MKVRYSVAIFVAFISVFLLSNIHFIFNNSLFAQDKIAYMIPDIGAPGTIINIEILAHTDSLGAFGYKPIITDSSLYLAPADAYSHGWQIQFTPLKVSWSGRLITSQAFIHPNAPATSPNCNGNTLIPVALKRKDGSIVKRFDFYIVQPLHLGDISALDETVLGQGNLGLRSPRGAMIVDSLILGNKRYTVSTNDCDDKTEGNQGYLPFTLTVVGAIRGQAGTVISVDAVQQTGGPGGGGGGGAFCDYVTIVTGKNLSHPDLKGGDGFTGGGPGGINGQWGVSNAFSTGGKGSGSNAQSATTDGYAGYSLNGVKGALTLWYESAGGGTGHPFGMSGTGSHADDRDGGYGGGSGGEQQASGGNGTYLYNGTDTRRRDGKIHGNRLIVPVAGGSGGASGNPRGATTYSGYGGGGGGAIAIHAKTIENISVSAKGGNAQSSGGGDLWYGGSGSGGAVLLTSKTDAKIINVDVHGGVYKPTDNKDTSKAGNGVYRNDAFNSNNMIGLVSDTTRYVNKLASTTITGKVGEEGVHELILTIWSASTSIDAEYQTIIPAPGNGSWGFNLSPTFWAMPIWDNVTDSVFYMSVVAVKEHDDDITLEGDPKYIAEPISLTSQAAGNIIIATEWPEPHIELVRDIPCDTVYLCDIDEAWPNYFTVQEIWNSGGSDLIFDINKTSHTLPWTLRQVTGTNGYPIIKPKDTTSLELVYDIPTNTPVGLYTDTISLWHNDTARPNPWQIIVAIPIERSILSVTPETINIGTVYLTAQAKDTTIEVLLTTESTQSISFSNILCNSTQFDYEFSPKSGTLYPNVPLPIKVTYTPKSTAVTGSVDDTIRVITTCGEAVCHIVGELEVAGVVRENVKVDLGKFSACSDVFPYIIHFENNFTFDGTKKESITVSVEELSEDGEYRNDFSIDIANDEWQLQLAESKDITVLVHTNGSNTGFPLNHKYRATIRFHIMSASGNQIIRDYHIEYEIVPVFNINPNPLNFGIVAFGAGYTTINLSFLPTHPSTSTTIDTAYLKDGKIFNLPDPVSNELFTPIDPNDTIQIAFNVNAVGRYVDTLVLRVNDPKCSYDILIPIELTAAADPVITTHDLPFMETLTPCDSTHIYFNNTAWHEIRNMLQQGDTLYGISSVTGTNPEIFSLETNISTPWVFDKSDGIDWWDKINFHIVAQSDANTPPGRKGATVTIEIHKANGVLETHVFNMSIFVGPGITATDYTNSIDFGTIWLPQNPNAMQAIYLTNSTMTDITVTSKLMYGTHFKLDKDFPYSFSPNAQDSAEVSVITTEEGTFNDTLEVILRYPLCDKIVLIPITVTTKNSPTYAVYTIRIESNEYVNPAAASFDLPVLITADRDVPGGSIDSLELLIRDGRDLFYPIKVQNAANDWQYSYNGLDLIIKLFDIQIPKLTGNKSEVLLTVTGIPMLSSIQETTIGFNGKMPQFHDTMLYSRIDTLAGRLAFLICEQGNDRLIKNSRNFNTTSTNPITNSVLEMNCTVAEVGTHTIEIVNNTGQTWTLMQWTVTNLDTKEFYFNIPISDIPNGAYQLIVSSPTQRYSENVIIVK